MSDYITADADKVFAGIDTRILKQIVQDSGGFVAGGAFKNIFSGQVPKDYDLYFTDAKTHKNALQYYTDVPWYVSTRTTRNSEAFEDVTGHYQIDVVKPVFSKIDVETSLQSFDFTVTKFAFFMEKKKFRVTYYKDFFKHLSEKVIAFAPNEVIHNPLTAYSRSLRYTNYGYTASVETQARLLSTITALPPSTPTQIESILNTY